MLGKYSAVVLATCLGLAQASWAGDGNVNAHLIFGQRTLADDSAEPVEELYEGAGELDFRNPGWPISVAAGIRIAGNGEKDSSYVSGVGTVDYSVSLLLVEGYVGLRKVLTYKSLSLAVGGGASIVNAAATIDTNWTKEEEDDDTGIGAWASAECYVTLGGRLNLGVQGRWSKAEVELFDDSADVGGVFVGALIGLRI